MQAAVWEPVVLQVDSGVSVSKMLLYAKAIAKFEFVGLAEGEVAVEPDDIGVVVDAGVGVDPTNAVGEVGEAPVRAAAVEEAMVLGAAVFAGKVLVVEVTTVKAIAVELPAAVALDTGSIVDMPVVAGPVVVVLVIVVEGVDNTTVDDEA